MADAASTTTAPTTAPTVATAHDPAPAATTYATAYSTPPVAEAGAVAIEQPTSRSIIFRGTSQNLVPGAALLFGGIMAFSMGMTDVYFAEAIAWTFAIWGVLLMYFGMVDINNTYEVTDDALIMRNPLRFFTPRKTWDWGRINRLDVVVKRNEARDHDLIMQVYYTPRGEIAMDREDRVFDATLAQLVVARAGLSPADRSTPKDVARIPRNVKATYTWK